MTGSMGRTSLAEGLLRVTPPCCLQSAMRGGRSTRWCTRAPPSPMPSRISGATSSSGSERSMSTSTGRRRRGRTRARHLRCGRLKGGKGKSPNSPSVPWPDHWAFKNPKGVAYCRDHHLHNKCSGSCGRSHTRATAEGRQSGGGQDGLRWGGTSPGCHRPRKPLHRGRGAVPARALQKGGSIPFPRTHQGSGKTPQRPRGEEPPSKGRSREEPPGQASSPITDDGGIRQRSHGIPAGGKPHGSDWGGRRGQCRGLQSRPSSCCTWGRMMRGPWMPTSMPTTRPSRSTFGRWISGERAETLARTCWARSLTRRCAPWPWRARSHWREVAPTAARGASSGGSPKRVAHRR